jgi:23S rRNA pseudouridine1911/1915/1917 synthase
LVDGNPCSQKDKISSSCKISINITSQPTLDLIPEDIDINIIDETDDYIIVNKKSGMVTHIAPGNYTGTLQNALYFKYPELGLVPRTGIIHRLDKNTSGILVICRNLSSHNILSQQLQDRKFTKLYHSLVARIIDKPITIEEPIARHIVNRKKMTVRSNGRYALSKIRPLSVYKNTSHVEIELITGRTHQIRVHLSFIKHPVIGDDVYGFKNSFFNKYQNIFDRIDKSFAQYLHAYSLSFRDPKTNKLKTYTAPYPKEYSILLEELKINENT